MPVSREEILNQLRRAHEMEEVMAGELIKLAEPNTLQEDIPKEIRDKALSIITEIKNDTLRHRDTVLEIMTKLKDAPHGS